MSSLIDLKVLEPTQIWLYQKCLPENKLGYFVVVPFVTVADGALEWVKCAQKATRAVAGICFSGFCLFGAVLFLVTLRGNHGFDLLGQSARMLHAGVSDAFTCWIPIPLSIMYGIAQVGRLWANHADKSLHQPYSLNYPLPYRLSARPEKDPLPPTGGAATLTEGNPSAPPLPNGACVMTQET